MTTIDRDDHLADLIAKRRGRRAPRTTPTSGDLPVTTPQLDVLIDGQLHQYSGTLNRPTVLAIDGPLDTGALQAALATVIERHEPLRTRYDLDGDLPTQIVEPAVQLQLTPVRCTPDAVDEHLRWANDVELDPTVAVPLRTRLLHLSPDRHILILALSHICFDGWSERVLLRDLRAAYAHAVGVGPALEPLRTSFADYARLHAVDAGDAARDDALLHWEQALEGFDATPLPEIAPAASAEVYAPVRRHFDTAQAERIRHAARMFDTTPFVTTLAAVHRAVAAATGIDDLLTLVPVAQRTSVGSEDLVGCMIQMMPIRSTGTTSTGELVRQLHRRVMDAMGHPAALGDIARRAGLDARVGLGPAMFQWRAFPEVGPTAGLPVSIEPMVCPRPSTDRLSISLTPTPGGIDLLIDYPPAKVDHAWCEAFADDLVARIDEIAEPLAAPTLPTVTSLVRDVAARTPDAVAITSGGAVSTYAALWERAGAIAAAVAGAGVQPGERVVIVAPRSAVLVAAMLGVWRAGAVVVPVDDATPPERLARIVEVAEPAHAVVVGDATAGGLTATVIAPDATLTGSTAVGFDPEVDHSSQAGDAYVFCTSGTTGRPKGVLGTHQGLAHFLAWERDHIAIGPDDRVSFLAGVGFDVMLRDVLLPLTAGATLAIPHALMAPHEGLAWLHDEQVTITHITPSLAAAWLHDAAPAATPALRATLFAGEPLTGSLVEQWRSATNQAGRVVNLYGPTETCMARLAHDVGPAPAAGLLPVGRPLPYSRVVLAGDELIIETAVGTRGYLTALGDEPVQRHATGDRAMANDDGTFTVLGRLDDQVKIEGVRVEPAGVAAVLEEHPAIRRATVVVQPGNPPRLDAFYVTAAAVADDELRRFLRAHLPNAAQPRRLVPIDELPTTANGKVDSAALAEMTPASTASVATPAEADAPVEEVRAIWHRVLGIEVTDDTDFFAAGGTSLRALSITRHVEALLGRPADLNTIFDRPVFAEFVAELGSADAPPDPAPAPTEPTPVQDAPRRPMTPIQEAMLFEAVQDPDARHLRLATRLELYGRLDVTRFREAVRLVHGRHENLHARFDLDTFEIVYDARADEPLTIVDLRHRIAPSADGAIDAVMGRPMDLESGPLAGWTLFQRDDDHHTLLLLAHHSIADGWSARILFDEISIAYEALGAGTEPELPEVEDDRRRPRPGQAEADIARWAELLADPVPPLVLSHAGTGDDPHAELFDIPKTIIDAIDTLAEETQATPTIVMTSLWGAFLAAEAGVDRVAVGLPIATRGVGTMRTVGLYLSTLPIHVDTGAPEGFAEVIRRTRDHSIRAYDTSSTPFPTVLRELRGRGVLDREDDVYTTMLQFSPLGNYVSALRLEGIEVRATMSRTFASGVPLYLRVVRDDETPIARLDYRASALAPEAAPAFVARWLAFCNRTLGLSTEPSVTTNEGVEISFAQERMWFLHQLDPSSGLYNVPMSRRYEGPLDMSALEHALVATAERHLPLRTVVYLDGDDLVGRALPASAVRLDVIDMLDDGEAEAEIERRSRLPFDLAGEPMLRCTVVRQGHDRGLLLLVAHHIAVDGWGLGRLWQELVDFYNGKVLGTEAEVPQLPTSYPELAAAERAAVEQGAYEAQLDFWDDVLAPPLPTIPPAPGADANDTSAVGTVLHLRSAEPIAILRRRLRHSNYLVGLTVTAAILPRATGSNDVMIGIAVGARPDPRSADLVGLFTSTVPVRVQVDPQMSFAELGDRVRDATFAAQENASVPFDLVTRRVRERHRIRNAAFFDTMFTMPGESLQPPKQRFHGVTDVAHRLPSSAAKFAISVELKGLGGEPRVEVCGRRSTLSEADTADLAAEWAHVLEAAAADPDAPLGSLFRPSAAATVLGTIDALAAAEPSAPSILGTETMTRTELVARSHGYAADLRAAGVGPGDLIGLVAPRSGAALAAMAATWRVGAAYVPIDPARPRQGMTAMLAGHGVTRVATTSDDDPGYGTDVIRLRTAAAAPGQAPALAGDAAAYCIPTSGSTGEPKLVEVSHHNLARFCAASADAYDVRSSDRTLLFHSLAFDASVEETWLALTVGASIVVPPDTLLGTLDHLLAAVANDEITILNVPTALFNELMALATATITLPPKMRTVVIGGEALRPEALATWQRLADRPVRLLNSYGPTEATVAVATADLSQHDPRRPIPIGHPFSGVQLEIVDGELWIGGNQVATGYRGNPEATARAFIADGRGRWYRSGDRASRAADGQFVLGGRIDRQVKIAGHRIEPAAVEAACTAVDGVVVAAVEPVERNGSLELAAAIEIAGDTTADDVRRALQSVFPDTVVPTSIDVHQRLPRSVGGKLDRQAIRAILGAPPPRPAPEPIATTSVGDDPDDNLVASLCRLLAEVLGLPEARPGDDFFDVGGRSLSAVRFVHRINEHLGLDVPVADIFEYPTIAEFAAHLQGVAAPAAPHAPARTAPPETVAAAAPAPAPETEPVARGPLPATRAQMRFWMHHHMREGLVPYAVHTSLRLRGALDVDRLRRAAVAVAARHEVLRTRLVPTDDGAVVQYIDLPHDPLEVGSVDGVAPLDRAAAARELLAECIRRPFDLSAEPPFRALLVPLDDQHHLFTLCCHHVAVDAHSMTVMSRELREHYETGTIAGQPMQYADAAAEREQRLATSTAAMEYWRRSLEGFEPPTLPGRTSSSAPTGRSAGHLVPLSPATQEALLQLVRDHRVTPFQLVVAAAHALIHRVTGAAKVSVGSPVNERENNHELGVGPYVNMVALRADIGAGMTFAELLRNARRTVLEGVAHSVVPFDHLVEELNPTRDATRVPFFDITCNVGSRWHDPDARFGDASFEQLASPTAADRDTNGITSDLMLNARTGDGAFRAELRHDVGILDPDTVEQMAHSLGTMLTAIVADADTPVADLPIINRSEERWLEHGLNATATPFPATARIEESFADVARRHATATAVRHGSTTVTYAELDARATALAEQLRAHGVRPGHAVGIRIDRSIDLVTALLGILRAGACYVPVDQDAPAARTEMVLDKAGVVCVVTNTAGALGIETRRGTPRTHGTSEPVAYIMFTSGSTGEPKGAVVPHRAVQRLVHNQNYLRLAPGDVHAMLSNPTFDALTAEVWGPLLQGASIDVIDRDVALDPRRLRDHLRSHAVTCMFVTTALFNQVAREVPDAFATVRDVLVGGEAMSVPDLRRVLPHRPQRLANIYGPTEATTFSSFHLIDEVGGDVTAIPIGLPIMNTVLHVLDARRRLVPPGVVGELYIGGPGVALGYLDAPELTAEKFVTLGWAPGRFYRTGDLVRRRRDGAIEFVGRVDHQVKIRGHRIELGEVERGIRQLPEVDAVLVTVDGEGARRRIVAHLATPAAGYDESDVRRRLARHLPTYMVPAELVRHDEIPMTPQGKLDRSALAPRAVAPSPAAQPAAAPALSSQQADLLDLFRTALDRPDTDFDADFFDLGGHSLLAIELLAAVETAFGVRLPMSTLFDARTPREIARVLGLPDPPAPVAVEPAAAAPVVATATRGTASRYVKTLRPGPDGTTDTLWLAPPAGGTLMLYEPLAAELADRMRVLGVLAPGAEGERTPATTVAELVQHQLDHILATQPTGPYRLLGYSIGGVVAFEVARRLQEMGHEIAFAGVIESAVPFAENKQPPPERLRKLVEMSRDRDVAGLAKGFVASVRKRTRKVGPALRRHAEAAAVRHLGVGESDQTLRSRVGAAMNAAWVAFEPVPAPLEIVLFMGDENRDAVVDYVARDWRTIALGGLRVVRVGGSHEDDKALHRRHAPRLAAHILAEMSRP